MHESTNIRLGEKRWHFSNTSNMIKGSFNEIQSVYQGLEAHQDFLLGPVYQQGCCHWAIKRCTVVQHSIAMKNNPMFSDNNFLRQHTV